MALLDQIEAVTNDWFKRNKVEDLYFKASIFLYRLLGNGQDKLNLVTASETIDGGKKVLEFLEHAGVNGDTYGAATTISGTNNSIVNQAAFAWSGYYGSDGIGLDEKVQNSGDAAMVNLIQLKLRSVSKTIRNNMAQGVFTLRSASTGSLGLDGLPDLFNVNPAIAYGNITETDMALWAPNVIVTAEAITYAVVNEILAAATSSNTPEDKPNMCITTQTLCDAYTAKLQAQQRFTDKALAEAGFENVTHKGTPISWDVFCPAGEFYAMNMRRIRIRAHKDYNFTKPHWVADKPGSEPDNFIANSRWMGVMTTSDRGAHALHTNLTA
jgi:hypothetical protein